MILSFMVEPRLKKLRPTLSKILCYRHFEMFEGDLVYMNK